MAVNDLTLDEMAKALLRISEWRLDQERRITCPRCDVTGLSVIDRSARPHAEWYAMSCTACGLEATLNIPLPGPSGLT